MSTTRISLSRTEYVKISSAVGASAVIEVNEGVAHVTTSSTKPDVGSESFHRVTDGERLYIDSTDSDIWARASSNKALLTITEHVKSYNTDAWNRNKVVHDWSILHGMFTFDIPKDRWYEMIDDVEQITFVSATSVDGALNLASGALNQKRQLRTYRHPRYEPNRGHVYSNSMFFPTPTASAERSVGLFTPQAGVGFRLRAGTLYAFRRTTIGGITTDVEQAITLPADVNLAKGNVYDIQFQWRGVGSYFFYINLKLVASLDLLGTLDNLSIFDPSLPIAFECINQGDATTLVSGCVDVTTEGGRDSGKTYGAISTTTESGSISVTGFNQPVLAVRNKKQIGALNNTRDMLALLVSAYSDQKSLFRVWATRDDTAVTLNDQTWSDFRDGHIEYIEYNNPGVATPITFDTTKTTLIFSCRVNIDSTYTATAMFEGRTDIYQTPGDIFIFTLHRDNGQGASVGVTYEFAEGI